MEGGWGFITFEFDDFEPNIDDSKDFNLGSTENSERFGPLLSEKALDQAIYQGSHTRRNTKGDAMGSQCISCVV